jgi:hypothetical protein
MVKLLRAVRLSPETAHTRTKFPANREINREFSKIGPSIPSFASDQHAYLIA